MHLARPGGIRREVDVQLDLVTVGIAHAEVGRAFAERLEPVRHGVPSGAREIVQRGADVERDVIQARGALRRRGRVEARELARHVVMVHARREEDDATVLRGAGFREAEDVPVEATGGVEIADEQGDVTELAHREPRVRRARGGCLHDDGSVPLVGHG